ncbi:MAG TPA: thioredoxin family protein [Candidatus Acidoferrum sp.]
MKGAVKMSTGTVDNPKTVSREEWLVARKKLLTREKQLTRERDAVAAERRQLPWVKVEKNYVFDSPTGRKTLADLFDGKSQLIVYHLMFGPEWKEACPSCSFNMDHTDGALAHLAQRDVSFAAVSRAPWPKIEAFKNRLGWKFNWVSSYGSDFNYDYRVSFTPEQLAKGRVEYNFDLAGFPGAEAPGISVFYKDKAGNIFHTYSAYARGSESTMNAYNYLDLVPKGRDEDGLRFTMSWLRHHDRYESGQLADADMPYWPADALS